MTQVLFSVIISILILNYLLERSLDYLDLKNWKKPLPKELTGLYNDTEYEKARNYDTEKINFSFISSTFSLVLVLVVLFSNGFAFINDYVSSVTVNPIGSALLFFGIILFASDMLSLPFDLYSTFVIEEKYGFNKTRAKTYIFDKLKGYVLTIIIGGGLFSLFILFYLWAGPTFWIYSWMVFAAFILLLTMFYSSIILPLFNKLAPLQDAELRKEIENYCKKVNFSLENIYVMDGSKRSSKANAFFSGLGRKKTIVLYDTLLNNHTIPELLAVLAHEIGHYKKKHTLSNMIFAVLQIGLMLYLLSLFISNPVFSKVLGSDNHSIQLGLITFALLYSPVSTILEIIKNIFSRRYEYEADRFAAETFNGFHLAAALKKLSVNNLSNLNPHPLNVFINYSHPPLQDRLRALGAG